jgi:DNA-binding NtrC family response regulator
MENRGNLNVVLSDLCLPDAKSTVSRVSGWQAESPGLQAVFVSGLLAAAVETEYGLVNGIDFLSKPFTISELRRIVGEAAVRCGMQSARAA